MSTSTFREQIRDFKRERILEEASALFYERGYRGATLDAIAERLEVSKPFIYHHFANKAELLVEIYKRVLDFSLDAIDKAHLTPGTARDRLRAFTTLYTHIVLKEQAIVAIFFREEQNLPVENLRDINLIKRQIDDKVAALLDQGVKAGEFRVEDVRLTTIALIGMINWAYTWYRPDGRLTPEAIAAHMADLAERLAGAG
jgi:AcrR family transcriptional regulator